MSNFRGAFQRYSHSEIQKKIGIFFCTSLGLHYLCTQKRKRKKYEERNRNY